MAMVVSPLNVVTSFDPPQQPWGAGHRGVDLQAFNGQPVYAAAPGVVIFAGHLVDRPVVSVRHGFVRTTYEPVKPIVNQGDQIRKGQMLGHISGRHDSCQQFCLHFGALAGDKYLDPIKLLGQFAPPVLRPIW